MSIVPPVTEKRCSKCGEAKPLDQFGKRRASADGLQSECKPCLNAHGRERYAALRLPQTGNTVATCKQCGAVVTSDGRIVREFCSRTCYHTWDRARIDAEALVATTKTCPTCGLTKPLDAFNRDRKGAWGRGFRCRACCSVIGRADRIANPEVNRQRSARYHAAHREQASVRAAEYRRANPEKVKEGKRRCYEAKRLEYLAKHKVRRDADRDRINAERAVKRRQNPEPNRLRAKEWYAANRDRAREQSRKWKRENPEKILEFQRERRARKQGAAIIKLTAAQWAIILDYFGHACAYCRATGIPLTQDHIDPLSRGGEHSAANCVPACVNCNSRKFARPLWRFLMERGDEHGTHG